MQTFGIQDEDEITERIKLFSGLFVAIGVIAFVANILQVIFATF